ncbi:MAG TPA: hypothetical protein ENG03_12490 [Thioploca sp.]|nr:MAG: hypothetical protein B6247_09210 [Beggiatoa sp. 4572_84]RKZ62005.1 MAG: hypothetical protein DRR08_07165 [Gammaproteobacteria bacterium]HDN27885.1 hypothetical protein [Thioploca sp.]
MFLGGAYDFLEKHPQWEWQRSCLDDRPEQPWTQFSADDKPNECWKAEVFIPPAMSLGINPQAKSSSLLKQTNTQVKFL